MTRVWSIGARTALAFAAAAMALTVGALVFVNVASQWVLGGEVVRVTDFATTAPGTGSARPMVVPDPARAADASVRDDGSISVERVAAQQWQWSAVAVGGVGIAAGGVGWLVSRRMLRPIDRITETTTRISASTLHERIDLAGPDDELRRLSRTVDQLLDRLEAAFESQRRFVAQAAHELRTPLAVQRAALQIGLTEGADAADVASVRAELLEQNRRTEHLVESLLVLAEAERGLEGGEPIDLARLVTDVVGQARSAADAAGVSLEVEVEVEVVPAHGVEADGADVLGEPTLVRQLLANLVDNAIEYNRSGGTVLVRLRRGELLVENTGVEVAPDRVGALLEPFRRGGAAGSRRHSGLGLSIVAAIARAHGWHLDVRARCGGGLCVTVGVSRV